MLAKITPELRGPQRRKLLRIPLWPWEIRGLPALMARVKADVEGRPTVIVVPGLWANDRTLQTLRRFLNKAGYDAQGWGLGRNLAGKGWRGKISDLSEGWAIGERSRVNRGEGSVPALCDEFGRRVKARSDALGQPIALVGWSLGGYLAREAARDHPAHVSCVITLGSPLIGGPKYSFVNKRYKRRGLDVDWIAAQTIARHAVAIQCPVTSIYSKQDAIVHWSASIDHWTPQTRHVEVSCTHTAFPFHAPTLEIIKAELDRTHDINSTDL
jgi:alpha-beta hydrolase superfamily lysophospholipase